VFTSLFTKPRITLATCAVAVLTLLIAVTRVSAAPPAPPFSQCPGIGADSACGLLIYFDAGNNVSILNGNQPPYDSIEDTLIGVQNDSTFPIPSITLTGNDIFGFDGDGICHFTGGPPCGPTGYEGPGTAFTIVDANNGTVTFAPPIPAGGHAYFSLEEKLSAASIHITVTTTLTYTGDTADDYHDPATLSAHLGGAPTGSTVHFTLGSQSCDGTTDGSGNASCTLSSLTQAPGAYTVTASYAGATAGVVTYTPSTTSAHFTISREETAVAYTGSTTSDYNDATTLSATLKEDGATPLAAQTITFTLGSQSCSGTTDASGAASCSLTPNQAAGPYTVTASFAGNTNYLPSSDSKPFTITKEETTLSYTGATLLINGVSATMKGVLQEDGVTPISGRTVTFTLGTGGSTQTCSGTTDASGSASCAIVVNQPTGPGTVKANFAGDAFYLPSSDTKATLVASFAPGGGAFVIGDQSNKPNANVTFWGAQWSKQNSLSGGSAPASFKGFALNPAVPACGASWTTDPGNSAPPPSGPLPGTMAVIVSSSISQSGATISGNTVHIVFVTTNSGYAADPGHAGTGTVVAQYC
jgi:hypothetical protein